MDSVTVNGKVYTEKDMMNPEKTWEFEKAAREFSNRNFDNDWDFGDHFGWYIGDLEEMF